MWKCFWANPAAKLAAKSSMKGKLRLLNQCVFSNIAWKITRWPWQKTIAAKLDETQARMICYLNRLPRLPTEDLDQFCRRRKREARNLAAKEGFWSQIWARRIVNWMCHLARAESRNHHIVRILNERGPAWLRSRRQIYVAENENGYARNSLHACRTGTRLNIDRPQTRWSEGGPFCKANP